MTEYVTTNNRLPKDVYREKVTRPRRGKEPGQVIRESVVQYLTARVGVMLPGRNL